MRQVFSRIVVASGLLTFACATALEEGPLADHLGDEMGGSGSTAGTLATSGSTNTSAGTLSTSGTTSTSGGTGSSAFGGTSTSGGAAPKGGTGSGGAAAGSSAGGKGGTASGGNATGGKASGGTATGGSPSGGTTSGGSGTGTAGTSTGTAGSTSATCNGVPDWTSKTYAMGDTVASTCTGVFAGGCPMGQSHKFECNPTAGSAALPWCMSREPGVGNGWGEAWLDKGQCQ